MQRPKPNSVMFSSKMKAKEDETIPGIIYVSCTYFFLNYSSITHVCRVLESLKQFLANGTSYRHTVAYINFSIRDSKVLTVTLAVGVRHGCDEYTLLNKAVVCRLGTTCCLLSRRETAFGATLAFMSSAGKNAASRVQRV